MNHSGAYVYELVSGVAVTISRAHRASGRIESTPSRDAQRIETLPEAIHSIAAETMPFLTARDLTTAMAMLTEKWSHETGIPMRFEAHGASVRSPADALLLRICHEALRNVAAHSCAERTLVSLSYPSARVQLAITDDGRGLDPVATPFGTRLLALAQRLAEYGGALAWDAAPGRGCTLEASLTRPPVTLHRRRNRPRRHVL